MCVVTRNHDDFLDLHEKTVVLSLRPTPAREAGPWPYATSGRGWNRASCCGVTGGRGPSGPHPWHYNGFWRSCGKVGASISISGSNKLLIVYPT